MNRVNYLIGNETQTVTHFDRYVVMCLCETCSNQVFLSPMYLLGYIPSHNRIYLADKDVKVYGYSLSLNLIEYQTVILRGDMETAAEILPSIPKE